MRPAPSPDPKPPRREDARLLRGAGRYVDDLACDRTSFLQFLRADMAPALITGIDTTDVTSPVDLILTGADLAGLGRAAVNPLVDGLIPHPAPPLAQKRVDFPGQAIAAVVAASRHGARDAAEEIHLDLKEVDPEAPDPAFAHRWSAGDSDTAFATAAHIVEARIEHSRLAPFALEPRVARAVPDPATGGLTIWLSTQTPHRAADDLAGILGLDRAMVRVIAPDIGGAFGGKASLYPEDAVVCAAALRLGRPVQWCASRSEDFVSATQGRGGTLAGRLAVAADGTFLGLDARVSFPLGGWMPYSASVPARNAARILPGPYAIRAVAVDMAGTPTPDAPLNIYRGAGRPEAAMLMERLADAAARTTGIDPAEIRRRNIVRPEALPGPLPSGEILDASDLPELLRRLCEGSQRVDLLKRRDAIRAEGGLAGIGLALYVEPCGAGFETAALDLRPDGTIHAVTGSTNQGQGRDSATARHVANRLGVDPSNVTTKSGDTQAIGDGIGALASRSTAIGGSALRNACDALLAKAMPIAADLLQDLGARLVPGPGGLSRASDEAVAITWAQIAAHAETPLRVEARHVAENEAWASGAVLASVQIDAETGQPTLGPIHWIDDAGTVLNPDLVEDQLLGGLAQGLGEALLERIVYADGQLLTGSLMDYAVPRASDMPPVRLGKIAVPSHANPLGAKGVGEAGCIGVPAAIANAILDALAPHGVTHLDMPMTAARIWAALDTARKDLPHEIRPQ